MKPIDIILLTHNNLSNTMRCVEALYQNTQEDFKITVIDDSIDLTPLYFARLKEGTGNVNYIRPDVKITSANQAINIGLKNTESDPVLFITNSTFVEPLWLSYALRIMEQDPKVGLVGFKLIFPETNTIIEAGEIVYPDGNRPNVGMGEPSHRYTHIRPVNAIGWAVVLIRRAAIPVGGLDETTYIGFRGADDTDNCLEMVKAGWKIIYNGCGAAYHKLGACVGGGTDEGKAETAENWRRFIEKWAGKVPTIVED